MIHVIVNSKVLYKIGYNFRDVNQVLDKGENTNENK